VVAAKTARPTTSPELNPRLRSSDGLISGSVAVALAVRECGEEEHAGEDLMHGDGGPPLVSPRSVRTAAEHCCAEQAGPPAVDDGGPVTIVGRKDLHSQYETDRAEEDVEQEDRPPGQSEPVGTNDEAGQDRPADLAIPSSGAEQPETPC